jgi:hypothetical protein
MHPCDDAAVANTTILQTINTAPADKLREQIEAYLPDQFNELKRRVTNERDEDV